MFSKKICLFLIYLCISIPLTAQNVEKTKKLVLITGCARSGTSYISHLLTQAGLPIGHEYMTGFGLSCWTMAVDSDHSPWGPPSNRFEFEHTFHQIRDPIKVIKSVYATEPLKSWEYICEKIPEINIDEPRLTMCAKYWYYWNLAAAAKAEWTYRIEDIDIVLDEIGARLGVVLDKSALNAVSRRLNTRGFIRHITWNDLRNELPEDVLHLVEELAIKHGYPIE